MNAYAMAQSAYAQTSGTVRTDRGTEYEVFARATRALEATRGKSDFPALVHALHENGRLWTQMATSVADKDNQLPQDLRARIFYLAEFTFAHSEKVRNKTATVDALIEVNTAIMKGLRSQAAAR